MKNLITFDYTKGFDEVSKRVGFVVSPATDNIVLLEIEDVEGITDEMLLQYEAIQEERKKILYDFMNKYGLNYKNFKSTKMSNVEEFKCK
jgi:hypothetical protein